MPPNFPLSGKFGGAEEDRTPDPLLAKQVLSQLSYSPLKMVGPEGFEPSTPVLSGLCSNQLSYGPEIECMVTLCNALIHYTLHNISEALSIDIEECSYLQSPLSRGLIRPYNLWSESAISCGLIKFIEIAKLQKTP